MAALKKLVPQLSTRQYIAILKGSFAYTLVFVLVFLRDFNKLNKFPIVLSSTVLVSIAGQPGLSVGACLDNGLLAMVGVGIGAGMFTVLAKLGKSHVAQGFVFAIFVYIMAIIKAQSLRYFGFSLLAIIMAFSGIYTSVLLEGRFSPEYLEAYLEAYCWGFAIVLGTNFFVFPTSAERELRVLVVGSLERISTFSHLLAKTYTLEITDEERAVRDGLNASIRADFGYMAQKSSQVALEVNWTRWSMTDYGVMLAKIRQMQQGLITSYSNLVVMEQYEPQALEILKRGLCETATGRAFQKLRRGIDLAIADIVKELAVGDKIYQSPAPGEYSWDDFLEYSDRSDRSGDIETGDAERSARLQRSPSLSPHSPGIDAGLERVTMRLKNELEGYSASPMGSRRPSLSEGEKGSSDNGEATTAVPSITATPGRTILDMKSLDRVGSIRQAWTFFKDQQNSHIANLLASGLLDDDTLRVHQPAPSLHETFYGQPQETVAGLTARTTATRPAITDATKRMDGRAKVLEPKEQETEVSAESTSPEAGAPAGTGPNGSREQVAGTMVLRVYSFVFGMGQVLDELAALHEHIVPKDDSLRRKKKLHLHFLERAGLKPPAFKGMSFREALSKLTGVDYAEKRFTLWQRIGLVEKMLRSPTSLYAFKTTCAVSIYTVFILAPSLKTFFVNYGLTGGLITIVVAMAPVLGQGIFTFVLQILGTGLGALYGLLILRIFHNVGGHYFNPYGLTVMIGLFAIPLCYIIYTKPMFFAGSLLAMNGAGIAIVTQYVYREIPGQIRPTFDTPAYRAGKQLTALALALGIALFWQVVVLRTPARQTLRIKLAQITFSLGTYSTLFSIMTESLAPLQPVPDCEPPPPEAVAAVHNELKRREGQIQAEILALMPLVKFSALEPAFGPKFDSATITRVIRTHQIILDRLREARTAFGTTGFPQSIVENFTEPLTPFRHQNKRLTHALFYLVGTSLATKLPLPHDLPTMLTAARNLQHDALVLSHRLAASEEGRQIVHSQDFIRYWFYLASMSSVSYRLESCESDLRIMLGNAESSPFVVNERPPGGFM